MRSDRGAVSTELAVLTPLLIVFMLFAVYAGRVTQAQADVEHAAYEAARAASLTGHPSTAAATAGETADANIAQGSVACGDLDVTVDTTRFTAGGRVTVTVACQASFADLTLLAVPGSRTFSATATEVVDVHRANLENNP